MYEHKVLIFDVETSFRLAAFWDAKQGFIPQDAVVHDTFLLSWAAKWHGEKKVYSDVLTSQEAVDQDDSRIVESLADMIRDADKIVAHNLDRFDLPVINTRLLDLDLEPLQPFGPHERIDTLKLARKNFRFSHNNLDYLARTLGLEVKHHTDFELWQRCYRGEAAALKQMASYNRQDVRVLEQVLEKLSPHVKGLPRMVDAGDADHPVCPRCGSTELQRRGYYHTNTMRYRKFQCQAVNAAGEKCRKWSRASKAEPGPGPEDRRVPL